MRESKGAREVTGIAIRACQRSNDLHFLIVGGGDDLEKQKRRVQQTAFAERVHFTGQVDPDEVPYYLGAADLALSYVPQNDLYDPQPPLKTAEYLACELPVVATDTQGQRIYLKHGDNGWLYEDDLDVLSDGIVELMGRPEIKNRIRTRARSSIQSFSWDKIVRQQLIRVYRKTIASQKT
jgi:glycosyltransferase involved in cell wall biosynthesis